MIDFYCERLDASFWAEPFNAVTNLAFIIAFIVLIPRARANFPFLEAGERIVLLAMMALLVAIGVGSSAFHTLANRWSLMADVGPITLFQLVFLGGYLRYVVKVSLVTVAIALISFLVLGTLIGRLPLEVNGSESYLAPLAFVLGLGIYHKITNQPSSWMLIGAAAVFTVSLSFRTIDNQICNAFPLGTHFIWHLLNGVVLYLCVRAFLHSTDRKLAKLT
ncbi:ceramidase domain-containing protein [Sessilibacter sp. MAH2]